MRKGRQNTKQKISIFKSFFALLKKNPRLLPVFCTALLGAALLIFIITKINTYSERLLPTSLEIEISNPQLYSSVHENISNALSHAQKIHEKRSHFLNRVNNILFSYDQIDQYWIRLGFDRKLQISATPQIPFLMLETKSGEKYVVSSTAKIIAKNPNNNDYPSLYALSAPEVRVLWKPKTLQQKNKINFLNNTKLFSANKEPVNFSWLVNQTRIVYANFQDLGLNYFLTRVVWNSTSGFQLVLAGQQPLVNAPIVLLGKENLVAKIKQLKIVLNDLSKKNLNPKEIDLDYTDKASFKI